jgi:hypothetical protein
MDELIKKAFEWQLKKGVNTGTLPKTDEMVKEFNKSEEYKELNSGSDPASTLIFAGVTIIYLGFLIWQTISM